MLHLDAWIPAYAENAPRIGRTYSGGNDAGEVGMTDKNDAYEIVRRGQSMAIRKRGNDAYISGKLPTSWFTSVLRELTRILDMRPGTGTMA